MPVVAAEGATGQAHFHDVVELTIAGKNLHLAIMKQVIGAADAGGNFVAESEVNGWETSRIIRWLIFFVETDAKIQSESFAHSPRILDVKSICSLLISAGIIHAVPHDVVTELPLATSLRGICRAGCRVGSERRIVRILGNDGVADGRACDRRVLRGPI